MIITFIIILFVAALIFAIVKSKKSSKENKQKVAKYNPTSKGLTVWHVSGLPVAQGLEMFLYDCNDKLLVSDKSNDFVILKSKITGAEVTPAKGINAFYTLTVHYTSDGVEKTLAVNGVSEIEKYKKIIDEQCNTNKTVEL